MSKRCLIIYSSHTGHTEKVALRFKSTFERNGWECDIFKIRNKIEEILDPPFDLDNYDFICVGSGVILHLPYNEMLDLLRRLIYDLDPRTLPRPAPPDPKPGEEMKSQHKKIVFGPDCKKSVVFVTYAGYDFGPKEAEPSLKLLALEVEHLKFECIGSFCCPGKFVNDPTPDTYHGDIRNRPDERDLMKAEYFIEDMLESIRDVPG